ncbi:MAG: M20/M25/M40 family metallo-hydrolase [Blastocatellia bacterium]|nr:M20/M25/M40 family metallo-hydrolase [Blastocatellia bacterium]MCS7157759.1 M20/M25/M40 family metallo-hydrolase [Blastocatellia bacterium]MDW8168166.1 M20/M25/M40 family metallo-hydrolase [Acidobacteriota bacterium]MDW8257577.1 M20/M25/M40 family metallo-hydrolase [Acidobacteriota bacterium]
MKKASALFRGLDAYIRSVREEFEEKLAALVEIPTVSVDPERKDDIERGARLAAEYLRELGATVEIVPTPGHPVVFGRLITDPKHPTVTIYNHLDVQPADPEEWRTPPFTFVREDGRYFGRGTTDDKGPALTALLAVRYAVENGVPLNVHFLWELEEEIGSPNFAHFMRKRRKQLRTDSVLVSDTIWIARNRPTVPYGLRGLLGLTLTLETGKKDAHSGVTGGPARNPIGELCQLICECYDPRTGRVKIPGFYDDVRKVTRRELENYLASGFDVRRFMRVHEFTSLRTTDPVRVVRGIMAEPTFEVHGIVGGYRGPGIKTIIPPRAEAKISLRLVPDQDVEKIFRLVSEFIRSKNPDVVIRRAGTLRPYLGPFTGPYADAARRAMKFAFGKEPAFTREGGSIGAVVIMEEYLRAPILFLGLSLPEHGYHAPNENYDWRQTAGGIKMFVHYFADISQLPRA